MEHETAIFQDSRENQFEYHTCGPEDGYPVLYMHGAIPMPFSKNLIQIAQTHHLRLIAVLRPGYGNSSRLHYKNIFEYALTLGEFIANLRRERFDVLGLSAGSPYCYALAAAYPERVNGVNICSGIPLANNPAIFRMNAPRERFFFSLSKYLPPSFLGKYGIKMIEAAERKKRWKDTADGGSMDEIFQKYVYPNWYGLGCSTRLQYKYWGFAAESITRKTYIYHSKADEAIPFEIARKSAGLLKNSMFFPYENEEHASERIIKDALVHIAGRVSQH
ncbi:MAG: alpha/beta hydrolase [Oscillospiraceae bacterium]|jgi:pimeloyl-ACP methyl ester carboxylesterase|nr:alpha/beta hydrolase [Oscillospiraceae bacterium]